MTLSTVFRVSIMCFHLRMCVWHVFYKLPTYLLTLSTTVSVISTCINSPVTSAHGTDGQTDDEQCVTWSPIDGRQPQCMQPRSDTASARRHLETGDYRVFIFQRKPINVQTGANRTIQPSSQPHTALSRTTGSGGTRVSPEGAPPLNSIFLARLPLISVQQQGQQEIELTIQVQYTTSHLL